LKLDDPLGGVGSKPSRLLASTSRKFAAKYGMKGGLRAIQVKVAFGLSRKQRNYLQFWSRRSKHGPAVIRKLGPRVFELPPDALSLYLLARLTRNIGDALIQVYPVGFSSDIPRVPKSVSLLFGKERLRRRETERLSRLSLRSY
jgi:hypothetical protein